MMKRLCAAAFAAAFFCAGCTDPTAPPAPTQTAPTITDSFEGNLNILSTNSHPFVVTAVGGVFVTLTNVNPSAALSIGVGTPSTTTGTCIATSTVIATAGTAPQLRGTASVKGNFCVAVSDVGNLAEPVDYTITVLHP